MKSRLELDNILRNIMGSDPVYYQPPSNIEYPCVIYSTSGYSTMYADGFKYLKMRQYQIMFIRTSAKEDSRIQQILDLPYCSYDRQYIADHLVHDVFTIYF